MRAAHLHLHLLRAGRPLPRRPLRRAHRIHPSLTCHPTSIQCSIQHSMLASIAFCHSLSSLSAGLESGKARLYKDNDLVLVSKLPPKDDVDEGAHHVRFAICNRAIEATEHCKARVSALCFKRPLCLRLRGGLPARAPRGWERETAQPGRLPRQPRLFPLTVVRIRPADVTPPRYAQSSRPTPHPQAHTHAMGVVETHEGAVSLRLRLYLPETATHGGPRRAANEARFRSVSEDNQCLPAHICVIIR